jgi:1-acyl-sn-glycerol-3-phosphate acyltransferase
MSVATEPWREVTLPRERGVAQARRLALPLFNRWYRLSVTGARNIPAAGPVIIAGNHLGLLDGPLMVLAAPRPVHALAKSEIFAPPLNRVLAATGQIPIRYEAPDRRAIAVALELLRRGRALGIFPEAHRGAGDVTTIRHGVGYLALLTRAPVVPMAILGTRLPGMGKDGFPPRGSRLHVTYGRPFALSTAGDVARRSLIAAAGESIRQQLHDLVAQTCLETGQELPGPLPHGKQDLDE